MGQYNNKGMYAGYDKNNKEREALDYYATPPAEVSNILKVLNLPDFENSLILEPCCGGGHMIDGILSVYPEASITGSDIQCRIDTNLKTYPKNVDLYFGEDYDFLSENYPCKEIDYIVMNPPFSTIIPFVKHSLDIARKGVLMFGRLQFLESIKRYEEIFKDWPPTLVYVYVDRVACYKNGDFSVKQSSAQAYAWYYWDIGHIGETFLEFLRSSK